MCNRCLALNNVEVMNFESVTRIEDGGKLQRYEHYKEPNRMAKAGQKISSQNKNEL